MVKTDGSSAKRNCFFERHAAMQSETMCEGAERLKDISFKRKKHFNFKVKNKFKEHLHTKVHI